VLVNVAMVPVLMRPGAEADKAAVDEKLIMVLRTDPEQCFIAGTPAEELFAEKEYGIVGFGQIFLPNPFSFDLLRQSDIAHKIPPFSEFLSCTCYINASIKTKSKSAFQKKSIFLQKNYFQLFSGNSSLFSLKNILTKPFCYSILSGIYLQLQKTGDSDAGQYR
jgi:hypothetical protein